MTSNQVNYAANKEQQRHNQETERDRRDQTDIARSESGSKKFANYAKGAKDITGGVKDLFSVFGSAKKLIGSKNDPAWYNGVPEAAKAAANVSLLTPRGSMVPYLNGAGQNELISEPGIYTLDYASVLPHEGGLVDANWYRAFQVMYLMIRKANSGARNWSIANMAQWVLAAQSIITLYMEGVRAYTILNHYKTVNRYWGRALCEACGFDADDLELHIADLAAYLNLKKEMIEESVPVPQTMPWFYRSIWLASNVFADMEDTDRAHIAAFVPQIYYRYGDVELFSTAVARNPVHMTLQDYKQKMDSLIDAVIYSEDAGTIAGDILKAFPNNHKFELVYVDPTIEFKPVYDQLVITQIKNAVCVPMVGDSDGSTFNVTEDPTTGVLTQRLRGTHHYLGTTNSLRSRFTKADHLLYAHSQDMTPAEILESNMLNSVFYVEGNRITVLGCGTEIITDKRLYIYRGETDPTALQSYRVGVLNATSVRDYSWVMNKFSQFGFFPTSQAILYQGATSEDYELVELGLWGEQKYIGLIPQSVYYNFMSIATASLLGLGANE